MTKEDRDTEGMKRKKGRGDNSGMKGRRRKYKSRKEGRNKPKENGHGTKTVPVRRASSSSATIAVQVNALKSKLDEILKLHRTMLNVQNKHLSLTKRVVKGGADANKAVELLKTRMPLQRQPRPMGNSPTAADYIFNFDSRPPDVWRSGFTSEFMAKPVFVRVVFVKITAVDTVNQQFAAEVYIRARWTEQKFDGLSIAGLADIEFHQCWDPQLKILNVYGDLDWESTTMELCYEPDFISPVLKYVWHVKGTFRERMELQHFPFDAQLNTAIVGSDLAASAYDLLNTSILGTDSTASAYGLLNSSTVGSDLATSANDLLNTSILGSDSAASAYDLLKTSIVASDLLPRHMIC
ncbi:cys-loop ligand-gated ionic channel [Plakobranchus ocellatus]|uniref:Cys-loop ligand-gated ionic channel n=1 Tax=Plakobranchus ocellatus TaxID=259542 RepID=A0AAV4DD98_9GAST|nr:cys-loop ligand-gated ionic channel [Plakobranchus ocellatus]